MSLKAPIRLILLRHGNTFEQDQIPVQVGAKTDMPLTQKGISQALNFASYLKAKKVIPEAIFAGSLKRQTVAASLIAKELDISNRTFINEKALTEIDYGLWESLTSSEIQDKWPHEYEAWNKQGKWASEVFGSSLEEHLKNISLWLDSLRKSYNPGSVVVGLTSQGVIRFFYFLAKHTLQLKEASNLKVRTGHFCELLISKDDIQVISWDVNSEEA